MKKILLGQKNRLKAAWKVDFGVYLEGDEEGKILLPSRYVPDDLEIGDEVDVFIYLDNEERRIATTIEPKAMVGDFAFLEVAWVNEYGAFLDWGLMKDLFVPFREQKMKMEQGRKYLVYVYVDEESRRIVGTAKIDRFIRHASPGLYHRGMEVDALIWQKTPLGFKVIVDNRFAGMIYDNQIFTEPHSGDRLKATVVNVRPDGRLDLSLQKIGKSKFRDFAPALFEALKEAGGTLPYTDKTPAEEIAARFGVSKKTFKQALGTLYKARKIALEDTDIKLIHR